MPDASWAQTSFLGGEWSKTAQGRFDDPAYRIGLNVCLNGIPLEAGAWTRRPGTAFAGTTRGGVPGRVITFNHKQSASNAMEFTDGHLRFWQGTTLVDTNDSVTVTAVSTTNPAVMTLSTAVTWATGDQGYFSGLGISLPAIQNRVVALTFIDTTHFSLSDPLTGSPINGLMLGGGSLPATATFNRALDIVTPYVGGLWSDLRAILSDIPFPQGSTPGAVLLHSGIPPYLLTVTEAPTPNSFASFNLAAAVFKDGPYLDPVLGGTLVTPNALLGNINMTLSFNAYDATRAYSVGDYVTSASVNYKSLQDANLNNTPASSPTFWVTVSGSDAIGQNGIQGTDIGRHVRLFSEPALWSSTATYSAGNVVAYGGDYPEFIGAQYWVSLVGTNTNNIPGTDTTHWAIASNAARWTWGRITGLLNVIDRTAGTTIGTMTQNGGLAAAFDGVVTKNEAGSAVQTTSFSGTWNPGTTPWGPIFSYAGKNFTGSPQKIQQAIITPSTDLGIGAIVQTTGGNRCANLVTIINLRAKQTAPASSSDGTLLATTTFNFSNPGGFSGGLTTVVNGTSPVTLISSDQSTSWNFIWIEISTENFFNAVGQFLFSATMYNIAAQVTFYSPASTGTSGGFTLQIVGDPLLYTSSIRVWRLGLFSNTTGFPAIGTYHEDGRLWLSGLVSNRIDSSRSNDPFNFSPTDNDGSVPDDAGISYVFNAKDVNPILGMDSDERGILVRTQGAEWLVTATTQNLPLSPTNIQAHPVTYYGSENVEARRAGGVLVFVQRFGRKLLEFFADVFSGRLTPQNLTRDSNHLTQGRLAEIAYQSELAPIIWGRIASPVSGVTDSGLVGWIYKRENMMSSQGPNFIGGHRHVLGSGRIVESICTGPSTDGDLDALTMVTVDGDVVRHVEVMTNIWQEGSDITTAWFLDDAVAPSSWTFNITTQTLTINGLWHLNGKTVTAFIAGVDAGDYAVSNGSISVQTDGTANHTDGTSLLTFSLIQPYIGGTLPAVVGFTYNSDGQLLRLGPQPQSGAATGAAFGHMQRAQQFAVLLVDTTGGMDGFKQVGISFGTDFAKTLMPAKLSDFDSAQTYPANVLFSGVYWSPVTADYSRDHRLTWRMSRPYPATIAAIGVYQQTQG